MERGNEKGHVERSVEVVRRKAFAFRDTFETLEEASDYLQEINDTLNRKPQEANGGLSALEQLEQERKSLLTVPPMFDAARVVQARVNKYATVIVDQNHYSVPDHLVNKMVTVKIYATRIQCFYEDRKIAEHLRLTGHHEWRLELAHYLETLKKKPGALAGSLALQQVNEKIKTIYDTYYTSRGKDFVALMQFLRDEATLAEVERSIEALSRMHPSHVTTDKIKVLCTKNRETMTCKQTFSQSTQAIVDQSKQHLQMYDALFQMPVPETEEIV